MFPLYLGPTYIKQCPGPDETVAVPGCGGAVLVPGSSGCGGAVIVPGGPGYPAIQPSPGLVKKKSYLKKLKQLFQI